MKNTKRIISVLLCVLMLASLGIGAFADTPPSEQKYPHFDSMFTIGDSNAMGYGLSGYQGNPAIKGVGVWDDSQNYTVFDYLHGVKGSFPELVASALGIAREDHNVFAYSAVRAKDALYFLGGDVDMSTDKFFPITMDEWMPVYLLDSNDAYDTETVWHQWREWKKSDDPEKGESPVLSIPKGDVFINQLSAKPDDNKLVLMYSGASDVVFSSMTEALAKLESLDDIAGALTDVVGIMWKNYMGFLQNVPKLIERVQELNPTCTLVVVGTFNPIKDLKISEDIWLPVFDAFSLITSLMNQSYKVWAKEYGAIYVDITDAETATLEQGLTVDRIFSGDNPELIYHATPEGYKYIARQILSALELEKTSTTDIVVDLGSVKNVSSVILGISKCNNYSFDPETHTLTVPCSYVGEKLLTVTDRANEYAESVAKQLDAAGVRVELDERNEKIGKKIREATLEKVPYMLVLGDRDIENGTVSVRTRSGEDKGAMRVEEFLGAVTEEIRSRAR